MQKLYKSDLQSDIVHFFLRLICAVIYDIFFFLYTEEEIITLIQNGLSEENDLPVNKPPLHLRNGNVLVFQDFTKVPTKEQKEKLKKLKDKNKKNTRLTYNSNFKPGSNTK